MTLGGTRSKKTSIVLRCVGGLCLVILLFGSAGAIAVEPDFPQVFSPREQRFVAGLKQRQLFGTAEEVCQSALQSAEISLTDQAALTVELIQIRSLQALFADDSIQQDAWERVWEIQQDFERRFPNHPRQLLVSLQTGLAHLQRAQRIASGIKAQAYAVGALPAVKEKLLQQTRRAKRWCADVERTIERQLPEQRSKSLTADDLTPQELVTLRSNVRYQIAVCQLETLAAYDLSDQANRTSAINDVLRRLQEVQDSVVPSQAIWWRSRITQVACQRILGQTKIAEQILATLPKQQPPVEVIVPLKIERLRLAIALCDATTLRSALAIDSAARSPELEIVKLQSALVLARMADTPEANSDWLNAAAQMKKRIETQFGAYWGRRAGLALIDGAGEKGARQGGLSPGTANTVMGDRAALEILVQTAHQAQRQGNLIDAVGAYDRAIAIAGPDALQTVLALQISVSQIFERQRDHERAADRLLTAAMRVPENTSAPSAHLRGCWNLAKSQSLTKANVDQKSVSESTLVNVLQDHIATWPNSSTLNQAAVWLMAEQVQAGQYKAAINVFDQVSPDSVSFPTAIGQMRSLYLRIEKETHVSDSTGMASAEQLAMQIVGRLRASYNAIASKEASDRDVVLQAKVLSQAMEIGLRSGGATTQLLPPWLDAFGAANAGALGRQHANVLRWSSLLMALDQESHRSSERFAAATERLQMSQPDLRACQHLMSALTRVEGILEQANDSVRLKFLRKFGIEIVALAIEQPMAASMVDRWRFQLGRLQRLTGGDLKAVAILEPLSQRFPTDVLIQLEYARALLNVPQRTDDTLKVWRRLTRVLTPKSEHWYEAKLNLAIALQKSGQPEAAKKMLRYLRSVYGWKDSSWSDDLEQVLGSL